MSRAFAQLSHLHGGVFEGPGDMVDFLECRFDLSCAVARLLTGIESHALRLFRTIGYAMDTGCHFLNRSGNRVGRFALSTRAVHHLLSDRFQRMD